MHDVDYQLGGDFLNGPFAGSSDVQTFVAVLMYAAARRDPLPDSEFTVTVRATSIAEMQARLTSLTAALDKTLGT